MTVIRQNHIGDGPYNVAYIIAGMLHDTDTEPVKDWLNILERWYKLGRDYPNIQKVIGKDLQDKKINSLYYIAWKQLSCISINENQRIYNQLNVKLSGKDIIGEAFYYGFPLLALDDYITVANTFDYTCYMTFPCSGDLQALSIITGNSLRDYYQANGKTYNDKSLYAGTPITVNNITYRPEMMICNDGYYRYYDREYNEEFDISPNNIYNIHQYISSFPDGM